MNDDEQETARVAQFMKGVSRALDRGAVPHAEVVWSRIQLAERLRLAERGQRPARLAWGFARCWLVSAAGLLVCRSWPVFWDYLFERVGSVALALPIYIAVAIAGGAAIYVLGAQLPRARD